MTTLAVDNWSPRARVEDLSYRLGRSEARAELTEKAESTLQAEREHLIADLERERERAERLERELAKARLLSEELEAERSKGFWRRLFGA